MPRLPFPLSVHLLVVGLTVVGAVVPLQANAGRRRETGLDVRPSNPTCLAPARAPDPGAGVELAPALGGGPFASPTTAHPSPRDPGVWYVSERSGVLRRVAAASGASSVALDLSGRVSMDGEGGLIAVALHPSFAQNGQILVYYTRPGQLPGEFLRSILARFTSTDGGLTFPAASEQVLLEVSQPYFFHMGGTLAFGPDGKLYLALGDGGDDPTTAQDPNDLHGKVLRLDVDAGSPYAIPPDNPHAAGGGRPEIWASGFRNPYRGSFDPATGALWIADVGEGMWEEVDIVTRGGNYGWPGREGRHCGLLGSCTSPAYVDPVFEYSHDEGCAVIGGFVARDASLPELDGAFVFADYCSRQIRAVARQGDGSYQALDLTSTPDAVIGFAQGRGGELLVLLESAVMQLSPGGGPPVETMAERLSQTGCVDPRDPRRPAAGLVPFDVVQPFWSDGASKERWLAIPNGTRISIAPDGDLVLPPGSVTMKSFRVGGQLVETRLFVRHGDGTWAGYSYEWNESQTEARLLSTARQRSVAGRTWSYPSRAQCLQCHTQAAGSTLGLELAQLNRDLHYPGTGRTANQISTLASIGLFDTAVPEPVGAQPRLAQETGDQRARAWLHSNCAGCHRPGGPTASSMDLRHDTPLSAMGICDVVPSLGGFGVSGARLLAPGDPARSILSLRARALGAGQMPPLGRTSVDDLGLAGLDAWIRSFPSCSGPDGDGDGRVDPADNCPRHPNAAQADADRDGIGDACETACNDGLDNDGDGRVDFPRDRGCAGPDSPREDPACDDGLDDDGDGRRDFEDIGCAGGSATREDPACADGVDNDGDGRIDFDGAGRGPADPECAGLPSGVTERARSCGLGAELVPLLAVLAAGRRARARRACR